MGFSSYKCQPSSKGETGTAMRLVGSVAKISFENSPVSTQQRMPKKRMK